MKDLDGRVAFVTGAGSGIGRAAALRLAAAGARVALLGRRLEKLQEACDAIESQSGAAMCLEGDVTSQEDLSRAYRSVEERWKRLDVVVANAGINGVWAPLDDLELDEWERTLRTNLTGTFLTVKHALPLMRRTGGSIVVISSVNGTRMFSNTGATAYACSKGAQAIFTRMTALELARSRIRINTICPGAIRTEIEASTERRDLDEIRIPTEYPEGAVPLTGGRPGAPERVADVIHFLATDASSHVTGTELWVDGGQSLLQG